MLNKVMLIGNLGADPEIRSTNSGDRVATMRIATSERWTEKGTGKKMERTEWHRVVCFNDGLVGVIESYCVKGKTVYVEGKLQTRKWEKDGIERYSTEIVLTKFDGKLTLLGGGKGEGGGGGGGYSENNYGTTTERQDSRGNPREEFDGSLDDEIPFSSMYSIR